MKVIFLDIDGVMVSQRSVQLMNVPILKRDMGLSYLARRNLRALVRQTNARIVITSSWRGGGEMYEAIKRCLARNNTPVYDETPVLDLWTDDRSDEIAAWLASHPTQRYVVLDDSPCFDHREEVRQHWVQVNYTTGLSLANVRAALPFLNDDEAATTFHNS